MKINVCSPNPISEQMFQQQQQQQQPVDTTT